MELQDRLCQVTGSDQDIQEYSLQNMCGNYIEDITFQKKKFAMDLHEIVIIYMPI